MSAKETLDPERWRAASPHLDRALELGGEEREAWLAALVAQDPRLAADVVALLDARDAASREGFLDGRAAPWPVPQTLAGQVVGAYTLVEPIGAGGMGSVWLARRSDGRFEGQAAVKLLSVERVGAQGRERFKREGSILARLTHPHIARLVDAGVSPLGQPYLVIEHVEGQQIDRYCDERALAVEARVTLFLDVLAAVAHAHASLIVHRDLKPSNVLVSSSGEVKLLDFGIAKLLEGDAGDATALTREGGQPLTPEYAAPEQVSGEAITTATDVYALGALLYVLLCGRHPAGDARRSTAELLRAALDEEPPRLSDAAGSRTTLPAEASRLHAEKRATTPERLQRLLRGDLDNVVAKALKKQPQARYASVTAFADDLRRYLAHEPVRARPDTLAYRVTKFVRRHRAPVALGVLAAAALVSGLAGTLTQARRATRAAALAQEQAARAEAVRDFLFKVFDEAQPGSPGQAPPSVLQVVKDAVRAARADAGMNALARIELLTQLGSVIAAQGDLESARAVLDETFADGERRLGREHIGTIMAGSWLAETMILSGDVAAARVLVDDLLQRASARTPVARARVLAQSAYLHSLRLERAPALAQAQEAVELCRKVCPPDDSSETLGVLANAYNTFGAPESAVALWEEALAVERSRHGPSHVRVASGLAALARTLRKLGRLDEAERAVREALAIDEAVLGRDDWRRQNHLNALVTVLRSKQDYAGAMEASREALRIARAIGGEGHPEVARNLGISGFLLIVRGDYAAARANLEEALRKSERIYGAGNLQTAAVRAHYGEALARAGQAVRGEAELRRALAAYAASATRDAEGEAIVLEKLARWQLDSGQASAAAGTYERVAAAAAPLGARGLPWQARSASGRARALLLLGRRDEARAALDESARFAAQTTADSEHAAELALARALADAGAGRVADPAAAAAALAAVGALPQAPARLVAFADEARRTLALPPPD